MFLKFEARPISIAETSEVTPFNSYAEARAYAKENDEMLSFGLYGQEEDGCWMFICDALSKDDMVEMLRNLFGDAPTWRDNNRIEFNRFDIGIGKAVADIATALEEHPEAKRGNSKVHYAWMRAKGASSLN